MQRMQDAGFRGCPRSGGAMRCMNISAPRALTYPPLFCNRPPPQPSPAAAREGESKFGDRI